MVPGVEMDGQEGWVASEYLRPVSDVLGMIDGAVKFADRLSSGTVVADTLPALEEIRAGFLHVRPVGDAGWTRPAISPDCWPGS